MIGPRRRKPLTLLTLLGILLLTHIASGQDSSTPLLRLQRSRANLNPRDVVPSALRADLNPHEAVPSAIGVNLH